MRELRHDFRAYYHVRYEDVDPEEAVDLILTLPAGSAWRDARSPYGSWSEEREGTADVLDQIARFMWLFATGSTEGVQLVTRPSDLARQEAARRRAKAARERMETTEWEGMPDG